jgi:hypothetical protein
MEKDLKELIGRTFGFYGVDNNKIKLDEEVLEVLEDEEDGYRSSLGYVRVCEFDPSDIFFQTSIANVRVDYVEEEVTVNGGCEIYRLVDVFDGHVWVEFGTDWVDDYYPMFVFRYEAKEVNNFYENLLEVEEV